MPKFKPGDIVRRSTPPGSRWMEFTMQRPGADYRVTAVRGQQIQVDGGHGWWFASNFALAERPSENQRRYLDWPLSAVQADLRQLEQQLPAGLMMPQSRPGVRPASSPWSPPRTAAPSPAA